MARRQWRERAAGMRCDDPGPTDNNSDYGEFDMMKNSEYRLPRKTAHRIKTACSVVLLTSSMATASTALADYEIQVIRHPDAPYTESFALNDRGQVVGMASDNFGLLFSFIFDVRSGEYTELDDEMSVLQLNNMGVMVGAIDDVCAVRGKKGEINTFAAPDPDPDSECFARGVNSNGKVSGYTVDSLGVWTGFVRDPNKGTVESFLPSLQTIAHGINDKGEIAGSVFLYPDEAYPGSAPGRYGFLRDSKGSVRYIEVTQSVPGLTRARGISNSGRIAGFFVDPTGAMKSYVTELPKGDEFASITLVEEELIHRSPCYPDAVQPAGTVLVTSMTASQINDRGQVVGTCTDEFYDEVTSVFVGGYVSGWVATPTSGD
jgi:hypothetical protein